MIEPCAFRPTSCRSSSDIYDDFSSHGGTGGKFREEEDSKKPSSQAPIDSTPEDSILDMDTDDLKDAFNKSVSTESQNHNNAKKNLAVITPIIQKMQDVDINVGLEIATLDQLTQSSILKTPDDVLAILSIYDRQYLLSLNDKDQIHMTNFVINKHTTDRDPKPFTNALLYNTINLQSSDNLSEWAWGIFNTAVDCAAQEDLKEHMAPLNTKPSEYKKKVQHVSIHK